MDRSDFMGFGIFVIIISITLCWCSRENARVNKKHTAEVVVMRMSVDTLPYRHGYKMRDIDTGVFNRLFLSCPYGEFVQCVDSAHYSRISIGDTLIYSEPAYIWAMYYGIRIPDSLR